MDDTPGRNHVCSHRLQWISRFLSQSGLIIVHLGNAQLEERRSRKYQLLKSPDNAIVF